MRGYLSTAFGCPFEGDVPPARVAELSARFVQMGCFEVSVSDTIGIAHPGQIPEVVGAVRARIPIEAIALHFHDTRGMALANVMQGLTLGVTTFDASAGGLGGCPYAPGATGNLATEDLVYALDGLGIETGRRSRPAPRRFAGHRAVRRAPAPVPRLSRLAIHGHDPVKRKSDIHVYGLTTCSRPPSFFNVNELAVPFACRIT